MKHTIYGEVRGASIEIQFELTFAKTGLLTEITDWKYQFADESDARVTDSEVEKELESYGENTAFEKEGIAEKNFREYGIAENVVYLN